MDQVLDILFDRYVRNRGLEGRESMSVSSL